MVTGFSCKNPASSSVLPLTVTTQTPDSKPSVGAIAGGRPFIAFSIPSSEMLPVCATFVRDDWRFGCTVPDRTRIGLLPQGKAS